MAMCPSGCDDDTRGSDEPESSLSSLESQTEGAILGVLRARLKLGQIFSEAAWRSLVVCNPVQATPQSWTAELLASFRLDARDSRQHGKAEPHIWATCRDALRCYVQTGRSVSLAMQGESGAGKTETAKHAMLYFLLGCARTDSHRIIDSFRGNGRLDLHVLAEMLRTNSNSTTEHTVVCSHVLIESLSSAKTLRNDNSSRSCHLLKLAVSDKGDLSACEVQCSLLETSRVVERTQGERSFHIFYQFASGATREQRKRFRIRSSPLQYSMLCCSGCLELADVDDSAQWNNAILPALQLVDGDPSSLESVFSVLSATLLCGELAWSAAEGSAELRCVEPKVLEDIACLLGIDLSKLGAALRTLEQTLPDGSVASTSRTVEQVKLLSDGFAQTLYGALFKWVVDKVNVATRSRISSNSRSSADLACDVGAGLDGERGSPKAWINILDVVGFEAFHVNSVEQLFINYCNERLHKCYLDTAYEQLVRGTDSDGLRDCQQMFTFEDNGTILRALEAHSLAESLGLLPMLQDYCSRGLSSSSDFTMSCHEKFRTCQFEGYIEPPLNVSEHFEIIHTCSLVRYSTQKFCERNFRMPSGVLEVLQESSNQVVQRLFDNSSRPAADSVQDRLVAAARVLRDVSEWSALLERSDPFFVKCVRSNLRRTPLEIDDAAVVGQLHALGVFEALRNEREVFPYRRRFHDFLSEHRILSIHCGEALAFFRAADEQPTATFESVDRSRTACTRLLDAICALAGLDTHQEKTLYMMSRSEVLLTSTMHAQSLKLRNEVEGMALALARKVQGLFRAKQAAEHYAEVRAREMARRQEAGLQIHRAGRCFQAQAGLLALRRVAALRQALFRVGAACRQHAARDLMLQLLGMRARQRLRAAVATHWARMLLVSGTFRHAAVVVQRHARGLAGRRAAGRLAIARDGAASRELWAHLEAMRCRIAFAEYRDKEGARMAEKVFAASRSLNRMMTSSGRYKFASPTMQPAHRGNRPGARNQGGLPIQATASVPVGRTCSASGSGDEPPQRRLASASDVEHRSSPPPRPARCLAAETPQRSATPTSSVEASPLRAESSLGAGSLSGERPSVATTPRGSVRRTGSAVPSSSAGAPSRLSTTVQFKDWMVRARQDAHAMYASNALRPVPPVVAAAAAPESSPRPLPRMVMFDETPFSGGCAAVASAGVPPAPYSSVEASLHL
mmetsp:Transcript_71593/g.231637  ORF Transcript_71593/g.231637 Transcript_71593/m.231637 type:complete len:1194 (-) Transcript_71593:544-4125(-)